MTVRAQNVLLLLVSTAFTLLAVEGILRLFERENYYLPIRVNEDGFILHKLNLDTLRYDNENKKKVRIKTNAEGFVGENHTVEKPSSTLRVAIFGDSYTENMQVDYDTTFARQTERLLNAGLSSRTTSYKQAEVLNFGVGGTGTADAMLFYNQYGRKYNPDIVVLAMYLGNDVDDNTRFLSVSSTLLGRAEGWSALNQFTLGHVGTKALLKDKLYRSVALVRFADRVVRSVPAFQSIAVALGLHRPAPVQNNTNDVGTLQSYYIAPPDAARNGAFIYTSDLVNNFAQTVESDGHRFVLMLIPDGMPLHPELLNKYIAAHPSLTTSTFLPWQLESAVVSKVNTSTPILSLTASISSTLPSQELYLVGGTGHLNEAGDTLVAQKLTDYLFTFIH